MFDFIGKRKYAYMLSILIVIIGVVGYFINGVQLDIQFEGGTIIEIQMPDDNYDTHRAEEIVKETLGKNAIVQKASTYNPENASDKIYLMNIKIGSKDTLSQDDRTKLITTLKSEFGISENAQTTVESVEPFIGKEIMNKGLQAIFWASVLIIIYIWFRFKVMSGLSAGITAIIALLHDILVMVTFYIIFKIPVNESFIAAILTVIGYSLNDTIIVYDRIRENSRLLRKTPVAELVNKSILQTLSRSINTGISVILCLITVYIFSTVNNIGSIREFVLPLLIGIVCGIYSTIFTAAPLYVDWQEYKARRSVKVKPAPSSK